MRPRQAHGFDAECGMVPKRTAPIAGQTTGGHIHVESKVDDESVIRITLFWPLPFTIPEHCIRRIGPRRARPTVEPTKITRSVVCSPALRSMSYTSTSTLPVVFPRRSPARYSRPRQAHDRGRVQAVRRQGECVGLRKRRLQRAVPPSCRCSHREVLVERTTRNCGSARAPATLYSAPLSVGPTARIKQLLRPVAGDDEAGRQHVFSRAGEPQRREAGELHREVTASRSYTLPWRCRRWPRRWADPHGIAEVDRRGQVVRAPASSEPSARANGIAARNAGQVGVGAPVVVAHSVAAPTGSGPSADRSTGVNSHAAQCRPHGSTMTDLVPLPRR